jgi:hypothetical protein
MVDRKSWLVKDEAILDDLLQLMDLQPAEMAVLAQAKPVAEQIAPQLAEAFYGRLAVHENTAEFLVDKVAHLQGTLQRWFLELFSGQYDQAYIQSRLKIGQIHVRIGLPVRYPLAMMDIVIAHGQKVAQQSPDPALTTKAFRKLVALDIAIFNQAYEDTQIAHLAEAIGNERLARRLLSG